MYLELVYNNHSDEAKQLIEKHSASLEEYYQNDLKKLAHVTKREHMAGNELTDTFKWVMNHNSKYWVFNLQKY